jgi:hypothetical protein
VSLHGNSSALLFQGGFAATAKWFRDVKLERDPAPRLGLALRTVISRFAEVLIGLGVFQPDAGHIDPAIWAGYQANRPVLVVVSDQFGKLHVNAPKYGY